MKRDDLRRDMRSLRTALPSAERRAAAEAAAAIVFTLPAYLDAKRIGVYLAVDAELDPEPLVQKARAAGKQVYLPVVPASDSLPLTFLPYTADTVLRPNRFRIPEPLPETGAALAPVKLDFVLAPLVAFDTRGQRLGMGGGYYDRSFAFLKASRTTRPLLVGYAYECQKVAVLPVESWDVPLAGVVTEQHYYAMNGV